ncbi:MAG: methionyl-tRNA formyltransferase [Lentisphaeria bacterium]|nr:methionyl-tRNA formyltransferase [Lentisphaeria bacterium]
MLKIYFLGSGAIAVPVLQKLAADPSIELVGIGTQPDRPAGRGGRMAGTPVADAADALGLTAERLTSVNDPAFLARLREMAPQIVLVVAFGQLLKADILALPPSGCVNIHASLLPRYRGASPILSVIRDREPATGVCFMQMEKGLDTGAVYRQIRRPLDGTETTASLEADLGRLAADAASETLHAIAAGQLTAEPQNEALATHCGKVVKEAGHIDWSRPAAEIEAAVRAYQPWPGARFLCRAAGREITVTLLSAGVVPGSAAPGTNLKCDKKGWIVACGEDALELRTLAVPGKREMPATAFLNGLREIPEVDAVPSTAFAERPHS